MTTLGRERRYPPKTTDRELELLHLYEDAYTGYDDEHTPESSPHHPKSALNAGQMNGEWQRYWRPKNFLAVVAEEPVGYLGELDPIISVYRTNEAGDRTPIEAETDEDKALLARISRFVERKIKPRQADIVLWQGLYGQSFAKVIYDPGTVTYTTAAGNEDTLETEPAVHVIPYPRMEGGVERAVAYFDSEDPDRVTSAVVYWLEEDRDDRGEVTMRKFAQLLYPDRIEWLEHVDGAWYLAPERSASGNGVDPHSWGVVPIAVCWNNGKPDLHDGIDAQITINKDLYDLNAIADQAAFPQRWRKGVIPPGGWRRNALTNELETIPPLKSGPFIMWDVPENGDVGQLVATDGVFPLEKYKTDVMDLAALTKSVAVAKMYYSNDTSGESKSMDTTQQLKPRIERKAEGLAHWARSVFAILRAMCNDPAVVTALGFDLREFEVDISYPVEIDRDEDAELERDYQDVTGKLLSTYTYLRRRGLTDSEAQREIERLAEEQQEAMDRQAEMAERTNPLSGTLRGLTGS